MTESTGRYSIGEEIYAMAYIYDDLNVSVSGRPFIWGSTAIPKEIKFTKLVVTEHHKVPDAHNVAGEKECDGYKLKSADGTPYTNQYPYASYGQTTDTGDRLFIRDSDGLSDRELKALFENDINDPVIWVSIKDHVDEIKHCVDDDELKKLNPSMHENFKTVYDMIMKSFQEKFPGKTIDIVPKPIEHMDGSITYIPRLKYVIVVDKSTQNANHNK